MMKSSMDRTNISQDQILKIFIQLYSLPKFADQVIHTAYHSDQRSQKVHSLKLMINDLYSRLNVSPTQNQQELTPSKYFKKQVFLRNKLIQNLNKIYPKTPSFLLVEKIYKKLGEKYEKHCEQLQRDIVVQHKEEQIKNNAIAMLENKFKSYDQDKSGLLQEQELYKLVQKFHLPKIVVKGIMDHADFQRDGKINLQQFKKYTQEQILKYYKIFYNLDSDNDERLNYKQTKQSLHEIYPDINLDLVFDRIFKTMDQDKTGLISFDEWCQFLIVFPRNNLNYMINEWSMIATNMIRPEESSSFMDDDLLKGMKIKHGKLILSWVDIIRTLTFGGIAGALSRTVTAPLQKLKVLYQTMYAEQKVPSISKGIKQIYFEHGLVSLFKGNSISVFLNCLQQALRFSIIQYQKKRYQLRGDKIEPIQFLYIGIVTGVLSSLILFPFQGIRIRYIATDYFGTVTQKVKKIYNQSGFFGFYNGLTPYLMSVLPAGSFNVMSYNLLRKAFVKENDLEHPKIYKFMLLGGYASLVTNAVTYPMSLLTSRLIMMNKDVQQFSKKTKTYQLIKIIYENEGLRGFYKGFNASTLRVFIGQSINFGTYQTLKLLWQKKNLAFRSGTKY